MESHRRTIGILPSLGLAIGRDDPSCPNNEELSAKLWAKEIPHRLRIWDGWAHDWPWWERMIGLYISGDG